MTPLIFYWFSFLAFLLISFGLWMWSLMREADHMNTCENIYCKKCNWVIREEE